MSYQHIRIGILTGEVSGDMLGAELIKALKQRFPNLQFSGILGPNLLAEGGQSLVDMERLSVMGFVEPLKRLPELLRIRKQVIQHFTANPPDVFIGIDSPDFNLGVELALREKGIPTVHYVSPSVWAWRKGRIKKIKRAVDLMLTLFPFEQQIYQENDIKVACVGHPLADVIPLEVDQVQARQQIGMLEPNDKVVAIMPGSRRGEIKHMAEDFIATMVLCHQQHPKLRYIVPFVNQALCDQFMAIKQQIAPDIPLLYTLGQARDTIAAADVVLCMAGTATFEAMLLKKPAVVAYKTSWFNYALARWLVDVPAISLPNLLLGKKLVPEFIQGEVTPKALSESVLTFIDQPNQVKPLKKAFSEAHELIKCESGKLAAEHISKLIDHKIH